VRGICRQTIGGYTYTHVDLQVCGSHGVDTILTFYFTTSDDYNVTIMLSTFLQYLIY